MERIFCPPFDRIYLLISWFGSNVTQQKRTWVWLLTEQPHMTLFVLDNALTYKNKKMQLWFSIKKKKPLNGNVMSLLDQYGYGPTRTNHLFYIPAVWRIPTSIALEWGQHIRWWPQVNYLNDVNRQVGGTVKIHIKAGRYLFPQTQITNRVIDGVEFNVHFEQGGPYHRKLVSTLPPKCTCKHAHTDIDTDTDTDTQTQTHHTLTHTNILSEHIKHHITFIMTSNNKPAIGCSSPRSLVRPSSVSTTRMR